MATAPQPLALSPAEYLAGERRAAYKSEYYAGETFAIAGASRAHNLIALDFGAEMRARLRGTRCEAYVSDMRARAARPRPDPRHA